MLPVWVGDEPTGAVGSSNDRGFVPTIHLNEIQTNDVAEHFDTELGRADRRISYE